MTSCWASVTTSGSVRSSCARSGVGRFLLPKDTRALLKIAEDAGYEFGLLDGVVAVNDEQFDRVTDKIRTAAGGDVAGKAIAVGASRSRPAPTTFVSPRRWRSWTACWRRAPRCAHDPTVPGPKAGVPDCIEIFSEPYEACEGADVLAVLTEWDDYRWLDAGKVAAAMNGRAVVDGRNLLDRSEWRRAGFDYQGIGRGLRPMAHRRHRRRRVPRLAPVPGAAGAGTR